MTTVLCISHVATLPESAAYTGTASRPERQNMIELGAARQPTATTTKHKKHTYVAPEILQKSDELTRCDGWQFCPPTRTLLAYKRSEGVCEGVCVGAPRRKVSLRYGIGNPERHRAERCGRHPVDHKLQINTVVG